MTTCLHCGKQHRTLTADECRDRSVTEAQVMVRVLYRAKKHGWRHAHAGRAMGAHGGIITPMMPGWPDLVLLQPYHRPIFVELKREQGELSPEQVEVLDLLERSGERTFVWRPSDVRLGKVEAILREAPNVR